MEPVANANCIKSASNAFNVSVMFRGKSDKRLPSRSSEFPLDSVRMRRDVTISLSAPSSTNGFTESTKLIPQYSGYDSCLFIQKILVRCHLL